MRRCVFLLLGSIVLLTAACAASTSDPQPAEVPVQPLVVGTTTPPPPNSVAAEPPVASELPIAAAVPAQTSLAFPARDPRLAQPRRTRPLLVNEAQQLEQLLVSTPANSSTRPALILRLAATYGEIARIADGALAAAARKSALRCYDVFVNQHPGDVRIDEALYFGALEHELSGDMSSARKLYYELIKRAPQSKLIPLAYFAFGELFFAEAVADPVKNDLAEQAYKEVVKYPPPANTVFDGAKQRLGEIAARRAVTRP